MVLIVMGVLDLTRAYRMQIELENAAREGASYALVDPNRVDGCSDSEDTIRKRVQAEYGDLSGVTVRVWTDTDGNDDMAQEIVGCDGAHGARGDRIRVELTATFDVITPMVEQVVGNTLEITGAATVEAP